MLPRLFLFRQVIAVIREGESMMNSGRTNILKVIICFILCICVAALLTSCVKEGAFIETAEDGTGIRIKYRNHGILTRAPRFEKSEGYVMMSFNGYEWYTAGIIGTSELQRVMKGELLAKSSNITVYKSKSGSRFAYYYVMQLEGTDTAWILFNSVDSPESHSYGTDFGNQIQYYAGDISTVPDTDFEIFDDENEKHD